MFQGDLKRMYPVRCDHTLMFSTWICGHVTLTYTRFT
jgi:hypothetical protein